jgi:hypothetical protein
LSFLPTYVWMPARGADEILSSKTISMSAGHSLSGRVLRAAKPIKVQTLLEMIKDELARRDALRA